MGEIFEFRRMVEISQSELEEGASRLQQAESNREVCEPVRDLIDPLDLDSAYAIQEINTAARVADGGQIVGRKIGLTAKVVQAQLGVDQPDFGIMFSDMEVASGATLAWSRVMQPKVEAEITFVLKKNLNQADHSLEDIADAIDYAVASIEIPCSRIKNWDIRIADTIADNASAGFYVLGNEKVRLDGFDLLGCKMSMSVNGEEVSSGRGSACLDNPLNAVKWLADIMVKVGRPLLAGDIVLSGALGPMAAVNPGDKVEASIEGLGTVSVEFSKED